MLVTLTSDAAPGTPDLIGGYSVSINAIGGASFTGSVTPATTAANGYLFPGGFPQVDTSNPDLGYVDLLASGSTPVSTGQVYGVGRVFYNAVTPGVYTVSWSADTSGFLHEDLTEIPATFVNGTLTITPATVPEPSSALLLALTGIAGFGIRRRRASPSAAA